MKVTDRTDFVFSDISDLPLDPRSEEQVSKDLFKGFDPEKVVDAYEQQLGIKTIDMPIPNLRYKHIMLSPGTNDDDDELLDQLMNDAELYHITNRLNNWTPRGELKVFIEYTENLDVKKKRQEKEKQTNE